MEENNNIRLKGAWRFVNLWISREILHKKKEASLEMFIDFTFIKM